jgi:hypothetical protein
MIVFGSAITSPEQFASCAEPGIKLASEPDSVVYPIASTGSLQRNYNLLIDKASEHDDLEALVLIHQDAEIVDPHFCAKLRESLSDPEVALVGCVGAIGVRSIAWWEGSITWASFTHRYQELGGGEFPAFAWSGEERPPYARTGEVDTIDGFVMVLSPWAVENLRFDEALGAMHGYDFDFCLQAREAGRKVVTADFQVIHHHSLDLIGNPEAWVEAHIRVAEKWDSAMPGVGQGGGDWKQRARRAEAEAALLRNQAVATDLRGQARLRMAERKIDAIENSLSWRITSPLRRLKQLLKRNGSEA